MNRIPLCRRRLPGYTLPQELANSITHGLGVLMGAAVLVLCLTKARGAVALTGCSIYGGSMCLLYVLSCLYHALRPDSAKKVLQVLDHCAIYLLIAGTYTPILLCAFVPTYPAIGWGLLAAQWGLAAIAVTLTAIDLKKYDVFSMICYIGIGWAVLPFLKQTLQVLTKPGFLLLLFGGIAYTIGAVLYGIGGKRRWMHSVFHIFVVLGSFLQFIAIYGFIL